VNLKSLSVVPRLAKANICKAIFIAEREFYSAKGIKGSAI